MGGVLATRTLLKFGCKHPVFIRSRSCLNGEADKRIEGYLQVCSQENITPVCFDRYNDIDFRTSLNEFILEHIQDNHTLDFDGIFANTDEQAYMVMQLLRSHGFSVPEDVQIIGFDGIHKFNSAQNDLYVSTICQPIPALAKACVDLVLAKDRTNLPSLTLLPVTYAYGGTTLDPEHYKKTGR